MPTRYLGAMRSQMTKEKWWLPKTLNKKVWEGTREYSGSSTLGREEVSIRVTGVIVTKVGPLGSEKNSSKQKARTQKEYSTSPWNPSSSTSTPMWCATTTTIFNTVQRSSRAAQLNLQLFRLKYRRPASTTSQ